MNTAPRDGQVILLQVREPAGSRYAVESGTPEGWEYVVEGRWDGDHWEHPVRGEPIGWKYEEPGDEVYMRLDGSYPGFESETTTAPND